MYGTPVEYNITILTEARILEIFIENSLKLFFIFASKTTIMLSTV